MDSGIRIAFVALVIVALSALFLVRLFRYRGKHVIICPETGAPAGTEIDAPLAAGFWFPIEPGIVVRNCSRWPEHGACDQACAAQIESARGQTLVRNIVTDWYRDRTCALCTRPIGAIGGETLPAGVLTPDGELHDWSAIAPADLPRVLARAVAICPRCELAEDFRRRFPELVVDRPASTHPSPSVVSPSRAIY